MSAAAPVECVSNQALLAYVADATDRGGRLFEPDGPPWTAAPLADVLEDAAAGGQLAPLPIFDAASDALTSMAFRRMRALRVPFVVRGHAAARAISSDARWRDGLALCESHPIVCDSDGTIWGWTGRQQSHYHRHLGVDEVQENRTYSPVSGLQKPTKVEGSLRDFLSSLAPTTPEARQTATPPSERDHRKTSWSVHLLDSGQEAYYEGGGNSRAAGSPFAEDPLLYQTLVPEDEATRRGSARSGPPLSEDVILRVGREPTSRYADAVLIDPSLTSL